MRRVPQHLHACADCGRPFYLCSERDCAVAPEICQGCELDRLDAYFTQPTLPITCTTHGDHHGKH
jgi:hypothetical protein